VSTRQANYPFNIYAFENNEQTDHFGGANDLASAVTLAAAAFTVKQSRAPVANWGVGIIDDTDESVVAYMGWHEGD